MPNPHSLSLSVTHWASSEHQPRWRRWQRKPLTKERHSRAECHQGIPEAPECGGRATLVPQGTQGWDEIESFGRSGFIRHWQETSSPSQLSNSGLNSRVVCFWRWINIGKEQTCQGWCRRKAICKASNCFSGGYFQLWRAPTLYLNFQCCCFPSLNTCFPFHRCVCVWDHKWNLHWSLPCAKATPHQCIQQATPFIRERRDTLYLLTCDPLIN